MKQLYVWITILFICGLVAAFYLIPSKEESAYISLKGKQYSAAELYYKKQYDAGVRTKDVIIALESVQLKEGNVEGAIKLMEDYVHDNPKDYNALQLLASLYESNQQYDLYNETLLKALKMNEEPRTLSALAREEGEKANNCELLEKLVSHALADSETYLSLASCYIQQNEYGKALGILQKRRQLFPAKVTASDLLFELWVEDNLVQKGGDPEIERKGVQTLIDFLKKTKNPQQIYYALGIVKEKYPKYLPMFISQMEPLIEKNPNLQATSLELLADQPQYKDEVLHRLLQLQKEKKLTYQSSNLLISTLLERKDEAKLIQMIQEMPPEQLDKQTIYDIASVALVDNRPQLIYTLREKLGREYLAKNPGIDTALSFGAQDDQGRVRLKKLMDSEKLTAAERVYFFQLAFSAGYYDEALRIGQTLPPYFGFSQETIFEIAYAYILMGKADEFAKFLQNSRFPPDSSKTVLAHAAINLAKGKPDQALNVVRHKRPLPQRIIVGFFEIAQTSKQYDIALEIADVMRKDYPSKLSNAYYASALAETGSVKEGMRSLDLIYGENPRDATYDRIYYNTVLALAKRDPSQRKYLREYMKDKESQGKLNPKLAREYVYLNIELFKDFCEGARLLKYVVDNCEATKEEVQTLLYMWGPHVCCEQREWIICQAWDACSDNAIFWLENLSYIGAYCEVIAYYEGRLGSPCGFSNNSKAIFIYLDALSYLKRRWQLKMAVERALVVLNDVKSLENLEGYAYVAYADKLRARIWEKALSIEPRNVNAWQRYGTALYDLRAYCFAQDAIDTFFELNSMANKPHPLVYQSLYQYGAILEFRRCYRDAQCYYMLTLCDISKAQDYTIDHQQYEALTLFRLELEESAIAMMRESFERTSRDTEYGATFVNMLMDARALKSAKCFFKQGVGY